MVKLKKDFYCQDRVDQIARSLIGTKLCCLKNNQYTSAMIVETESYSYIDDDACHSFLHGYTSRTKIMFAEGGHVYTYICYGMHVLFNIVTNQSRIADAVLIRAVEPLEGVEYMKARRNLAEITPKLTSGPGNVSAAIGITLQDYGISLLESILWIEPYKSLSVTSSPRIGIPKHKRSYNRAWRFYCPGNSFVSGKK